MKTESRKICFVLEGLNFHGGAHVATSRLMRELVRRGIAVDVLTDAEPSDESRRLFPASEFKVAPIPLRNVRWLVRGILTKLRIGWYPVWTLDPDGSVRRWLGKHDVVCVQSELSQFRHMVSTLTGPVRKVQMIHTDYANWANFKECGVRGPKWFRRVTARWDRWWYARMDVIAVIGESNAEKMRKMMPHLAGKIAAFHNLFEVSTIHPWAHFSEMRKEEDSCVHCSAFRRNAPTVRLVSLTRVHTGSPKCCEWYLAAAKALKAADVPFDWTIYGNGRDFDLMCQWVREAGLAECVHLPGYSKDAAAALANADLTILLSAYEGLPNVIYESMLAGTPVFSTDVGGVREMIRDGETGWIAPTEESAFCSRLVEVVKDTPALLRARENLRGYTYDNEAALAEHLNILGVHHADEASCSGEAGCLPNVGAASCRTTERNSTATPTI